MNIRLLMAGGVLAIAAAIGSQMDLEEKPEPMTVSQEISVRKIGEEIRTMRTQSTEIFKAENGKLRARVYARPKYFRDAEADTLRPLDLTVREISALAKLNPLRTHDRYVDAGPYTSSWMDDRPHDYRMDAGGVYVKYRALHADKGMTATTETTPDGMKQTYALADSTVVREGDPGGEGDSASRPYTHTLRWLVETDGSLVAQADNSYLVRARDGSTPMRIEKPKAWDRDGAPVMAVASVAGDTLAFQVTMLPGQKYPVTVDPSTTITAGAQSGYVRNANANYLTGRNSTSGNDASPNYIEAGQNYSTPNYYYHRGILNFAIPGMSSCSACTLYVDGAFDESTTDFNVNIYGANAARPTLTTADFSKFNGWQSSGAYTGTVLNNTWNTSSYSGGWNAIVFNSAGLDSVVKCKGDTLWIATLSSRDVAGTQPTGVERVTFSSSPTPYLSISYTVPTINWPTGFLMTPIAGAKDSMLVSWVNNCSSGIDSLILKTYPDSQRVATLTKTATSARIGGLNPYQKYRWYVRADSAHIYGYSNADSMWTCQIFKTENFSLVNYGCATNAATAVYDSARAETKADSLSTGLTYLGQQKNGSTYYIFRHYQNIALPAMMKAQAETLVVKGTTDNSATDFNIVARSGLWVPATSAKAKFYTFDGWQPLMTAYTGSALTTAYSTSGFTLGATLNKIAFTQAGRDTTLKRRAAGDSLKILFLSSRDISATAPSGNEYVIIDPANSYVRLAYAPPDSAPSGFTLTSISSDSLLATWTDRSYSERGFIVVDASTGAKVAGTDTTFENATSLRVGGLSTNTEYTWKVKAVGGGAHGFLSAADSCYTLANTPGKPVVNFPAGNLLKFIISANDNPDYTKYAVQDSLTGRYVDGTAEPETLRAGPPGEWGWRSYVEWGGALGDTLAGVQPGGFYVIRAKARNGQ